MFDVRVVFIIFDVVVILVGEMYMFFVSRCNGVNSLFEFLGYFFKFLKVYYVCFFVY